MMFQSYALPAPAYDRSPGERPVSPAHAEIGSAPRAAGAGCGGARSRQARAHLAPPGCRGSCPAASSSAWRWPGRSWRQPRVCCSTSRCPKPGTPDCARTCSRVDRVAPPAGADHPSSSPHDQEEALSLADLVVLMRDGRSSRRRAPDDLLRSAGDRLRRGFPGGRQPDRGHRDRYRHGLDGDPARRRDGAVPAPPDGRRGRRTLMLRQEDPAIDAADAAPAAADRAVGPPPAVIRGARKSPVAARPAGWCCWATGRSRYWATAAPDRPGRPPASGGPPELGDRRRALRRLTGGPRRGVAAGQNGQPADRCHRRHRPRGGQAGKRQRCAGQRPLRRLPWPAAPTAAPRSRPPRGRRGQQRREPEQDGPPPPRRQPPGPNPIAGSSPSTHAPRPAPRCRVQRRRPRRTVPSTASLRQKPRRSSRRAPAGWPAWTGALERVSASGSSGGSSGAWSLGPIGCRRLNAAAGGAVGASCPNRAHAWRAGPGDGPGGPPPNALSSKRSGATCLRPLGRRLL